MSSDGAAGLPHSTPAAAEYHLRRGRRVRPPPPLPAPPRWCRAADLARTHVRRGPTRSARERAGNTVDEVAERGVTASGVPHLSPAKQFAAPSATDCVPRRRLRRAEDDLAPGARRPAAAHRLNAGNGRLRGASVLEPESRASLPRPQPGREAQQWAPESRCVGARRPGTQPPAQTRVAVQLRLHDAVAGGRLRSKAEDVSRVSARSSKPRWPPRSPTARAGG